MTHALGLRNWNSAAWKKLTGRRLSRASVSVCPSIRQPRYSRYAAPTQPSAPCSAGQRANSAERPAHTASSCTTNPKPTPKICGTVRRKPKFAPEAVSITLLGPGVIDMTKV